MKITSRFSKFLYTKNGRILISFILGIGLSTFFRKKCIGKQNCIHFIAPDVKDVINKTNKYNDTCYEYNTVSSLCGNKKTVSFK
jgi:hypothetical protein